MVQDLSINEFLNFLKNPRKYCLITHRNADIDALASALVLREIIVKLNKLSEAYVITPEGVDAVSKNFIVNLGIPHNIYDDTSFDRSCDTFIVVDSASREQLGRYSYISSYVLVDHHVVNSLIDDALIKLYDPSRKATSEIVSLLLLSIDSDLSSEYLTLLIGGILYDSRLLQLADGTTFKILSDLIGLGGSYDKARSLLIRKSQIDYSERIARLKGMSRLGIYKSGKYLITITCVGAYEGNILKILIDNGADIGIAVACRDDGLRITVRVSEDVVKELGKPLGGLLASYVASNLGGSGGGHSLAGGSYVKGITPKELLSILKEFFSSITGDFKIIDNGRWIEECS
ncbi:MAG: DHH family phosphoesterase [Sulfolobales archaeon]